MLDKKPFFEFDFEQFTDSDIAVLERFRKEVFNVEGLVSYAEDLVFLSTLKNLFKNLLRDPSDEFTRFAVSAAELVEGRVTQKVIDRFKPLVKESISAAILEIVGQSFLQTTPVPPPETTSTVTTEEAGESSEEVPTSRVVTTDEELKIFDLITQMVSEHVPEPGKLRYQDTERYFSVLYAKTTGWFARMVIQRGDKRMVGFRLPLERVRELAPGFQVDEPPTWIGTSRIYFSAPEDLLPLRDLFIAAVREVV